MHKSIFLFCSLGVLACLLASLSGCGGTERNTSVLGRLGESCVYTGDCQDGLKCIDETCVSNGHLGTDASNITDSSAEPDANASDVSGGSDSSSRGDIPGIEIFVDDIPDSGYIEDTAPPPAAPTNLSYSSTTAYYNVGTTITPNTPTNDGGPVESYSVAPPLPDGLVLDEASGIISGTPVATADRAVYTVTATNGGGNTTADLSITVYPEPVPCPEINSFKADPTEVEWGADTAVKFTANFSNGTGVITPGNVRIYSGSSVSIKTNQPTTYTLTVTGEDSSTITDEVSVDTYLTGRYEYNSYGSYPIEAHFSFSKTGSGNFYWTRTFPGSVDGWGGVFQYQIEGTTVDLYWTDGDRSGTHSPISYLGSGYLTFEGATYTK